MHLPGESISLSGESGILAFNHGDGRWRLSTKRPRLKWAMMGMPKPPFPCPKAGRSTRPLPNHSVLASCKQINQIPWHRKFSLNFFTGIFQLKYNSIGIYDHSPQKKGSCLYLDLKKCCFHATFVFGTDKVPWAEQPILSSFSYVFMIYT